MKKYIYIIFIAFLAISCENEIPFNIDENPPKLIVNALFDAKKEKNEIMLALTGRERTTYVKEASIDIYVNGILKDHITKPKSPCNEYDYYRYETDIRFLPDDVIKLEVSTNDNKYQVQSEVIVPRPTQIEKIDTTFYSNQNKWSYSEEKFIRIKTTFTDDGKKTNYYRIALELNFEIDIEDPVSLEIETKYEKRVAALIVREDVVLTDGRPSTEVEEDNELFTTIQNYYGVFDNSRINGTYTMTTSIRDPYFFSAYLGFYGDEYVKRIGGSVSVRLLSISEMQYFYFKALNIYDSVDYDDFFSPPVKFPSNIEGGAGIFGVSIGDEVVLPLEDYYPQ